MILAFKPISTALFVLFAAVLFGAGLVQADPVITLNPVSQTVTSGQIVTFTAGAEGTPVPTVQWQWSTDGGVTYGNLAGTTRTNLSFTVLSGNNGYKFRAVFTNPSGTATTTVATLTVNSSPQVMINPGNQPVSAGNVATFTAAAVGTPVPTVYWQLSSDGGAAFANISGATATTLSFTTMASQNGYQYRAVFTNSAGSATTTAAMLTVSNSPQVTLNPVSQTVTYGQPVTFTAAASGTPVPTVQWQSSTDGGATFGNLAGATTTTLSFTTQASGNGNLYRAVFTNKSGSATTTAATLTLTLNIIPQVTLNPVSQTVSVSNVVTFTAGAEGTPVPTVQWQWSTDGGVTYGNLAGTTRTNLSFTVLSGNNGYKFRAVFTNPSGTATTTVATLTVNSSPQVMINPGNQPVSAGNVATFTAAAVGTPVPTVYWQLSSDGGAAFANISGATATTLSFTTMASQNGYQYRAVFTNSAGSATTTAAMLTVNSGPQVMLNPVSQTVSVSNVVTFTAGAEGTPVPTVQWQWSTDGGVTYGDLAGTTKSNFSFTVLAENNGYKFRAVFANSVGTATTMVATLTVNSSPQVTTSPVSQTLTSGQKVTFTATAVGTPVPPVHWQWSSDGGATFTNIPGATATKLSFKTHISQNDHQYRAVFTNSLGTATTTVAILTVSNSPLLTLNPVSQTVGAGIMATFRAAASGNPTPTVHWQVSSNGGVTFTNIPGATAKKLSFKTKASQNGNQYRAVFKNKYGSAITTAATLTLTVTNGPAVTLNPVSQTVVSDQTAALTIGYVPQLTGINLAGTTVNLSGTNAVAGSYVLVSSTDLATAPAQWTAVATNTLSDASGFNVSVPNQYSNNIGTRFYRYRTP